MRKAVQVLVVVTGLTSVAHAEEVSNIDMSSGTGFPNKKPLDIKGFYPGMPAPEAYSALQKIGQVFHLDSTASDGSNYSWYMKVDKGRGDYKHDLDRVVAIASEPDAGNQLIAVYRYVQYTPNNSPQASVLIKSLLAKFGDKIDYRQDYDSGRREDQKNTSLSWAFPAHEKYMKDQDCPINTGFDFDGPSDYKFAHGREAWIKDFKNNFKKDYMDDEFKKKCHIVVQASVLFNYEDRVTSFHLVEVDYDRAINGYKLIEDSKLQREKAYKERPFAPQPKL